MVGVAGLAGQEAQQSRSTRGFQKQPPGRGLVIHPSGDIFQNDLRMWGPVRALSLHSQAAPQPSWRSGPPRWGTGPGTGAVDGCGGRGT